MQASGNNFGASSDVGRSPLRVGIDIGGTFTDFVLTGPGETGLLIGKRLTTPDDPSRAVVEGVAELLARTGRPPEDLEVVIHATTLVTNTVIERTGAKVGLLTTAGFRDVLEIGNELRYDIYDLFMRRPEPLVPRRLRKGIAERTMADGTVLKPVDRDAAAAAVRELLAEGVESIAVCLLHAYASPDNERALRDVISAVAPELPVTLSSALLPEVREYERLLATVINAFVQPRIRAYLDRLGRGLADLDVAAPLYIMQSSGGLTTARQAAIEPVTLNESGPAAGAICAARTGRTAGLDRLISFDMGGTTAKTALILDGKPSISVDQEFARMERFRQGSGFPIRIPSVELIEIGAGGGSTVWIDELGLMKVGPRSAGSKPGPVCYGLGGTQPTVTDADLLLGYLDCAAFLGGEMPLDFDRAHDAIETRLARPLGLSVIETAWGIHQIVNENMALASRIHIIERGEDPRNFSMIAFGGAGPVHAQGVASRLGVRGVIFPVAAGAASALGLLLARPLACAVRTCLCLLDRADWQRIDALYAQMQAQTVSTLSAIVGERWTVGLAMDLRYAGQGYSVTIPMPVDDGERSTDTIRDAFEQVYARAFGRIVADRPLEIVNLRLSIHGTDEADSPLIVRETVAGVTTRASDRKAYFGKAHGHLWCPVLRRSALAPGVRGEGPALVEERESTIVVGPGQRWRVDDAGNFILDLQ